jgi:RNA polymerase-binding protein
MSERALRGTRLGATSYETDSGIDLAPRQDVEYACPSGHRFRMPFSVEAEVPMVWECRVCGAQALRVGGVAEEDKPVKPARTHWDMLLERRSIPELEEVLAERLDVLRHGGIGGHAARARHTAPPVNLATGAPEPDKASSAPKATASTAAKKTTAAKKAPAKKTTAGTAPAKKTAASKPAPATKTTDRPIKKTAAKRPSAK